MLYKCKTIKQLKQVHLRMLINGLRDDDNCNYLAEKVMLFTSDLISFDYAYNVFMYLSSNPNISFFNVLIKSSIGKSDYIAASAYNRMCNQDNISPDRFTFGFLFKSFASSYWLKGGEMMHAHVIKLGFVSDTFVMNSLLELYFKFVESRNELRAVRKVFDEMPVRDIVSWNTMISGLVNNHFFFEALSVFDDMLLLADHRCNPDETTLTNAYIKENKLVLSLSLGNALIDMFLTYNDLGKAEVVFKSMSRRCTFTWQRMLEGLEDTSFCKEALLLFDTMCCCSEEEGGPKPDGDIFYSVIAAFNSDVSLLGDGKRLFRAIHKMVHGFGVKPGKYAYRLMIRILANAGWVEAAIDDVNSKHRPCCFMKRTLEIYTLGIFDQRHNDVNCVKLMVDSLITKLPEQKHVDWLNKYLQEEVERKASAEAYNHRHDCDKSAHAQEAHTPLDDEDVYKVVHDLHDQMISVKDDPCQRAI
ncbi:hypothetical protein CASFOL_003197 [Castilleja foliolosa]|uniref:Pentatricopeptide repeat-containing protein n=1 Tax=Castilleja foliolosa TaxID=1961234 RepID=A0ABD3EJV0_9LAMI